MSKLEERIKEALNTLEVKEISNTTWGVVFKDACITTNHWFVDLMRELHDGRLPNDWVFRKVREVLIHLDYLTPYEMLDSEQIAIDCVDIYTHDLMSWLGDFSEWVDDHLAEVKEMGSFNDMVSYAQIRHIESLVSGLVKGMRDVKEVQS